jgi:hypothetical protein
MEQLAPRGQLETREQPEQEPLDLPVPAAGKGSLDPLATQALQEATQEQPETLVLMEQLAPPEILEPVEEREQQVRPETLAVMAQLARQVQRESQETLEPMDQPE